jgi:uncharacterized YccA/Bax inhibitor family protein
MSEEQVRSGSPALGKRFLAEKAAEGEAAFTAHGAVNKTGILTLILVLGGALAWHDPAGFAPALIPAMVLGLILALVIIFVPATVAVLAPAYALTEGVLLGVVSVAYEHLYQGIVFQAALGTSLVLATMVAGYATGLLRFGQRGRAVIVAATLGLALVYLVSMVLGMFGHPVGLINDSGPWGIAFSVGALVIAALNLSLDFDFFAYAEQEGLSKRMEWFAGFGVLVTLVWVYLEMLRLLSKIRGKK